jgi:hypothetical protein
MNDAHCLVKVLEKRFKEVEYHHGNPQQLIGYIGDRRTQKAEVIVRRKFVGGSSNDIGFARDGETGNFSAIISDYDGYKHGALWLQNLTKDYLVEKATALMAEQDAELAEPIENLPDGSIRMKFHVHA